MMKDYDLNHNIIFRDLLDYVLNMINADEEDYYQYWKLQSKKFDLNNSN